MHNLAVALFLIPTTLRGSDFQIIRESRILAPVRLRTQAAALRCLRLQIAVASPDPQTCAFSGTEVSRKTRSPQRERQKDTETETQRDTERHRETQRDTERHRETQRDTERHRETQRDTERHRDTEREREGSPERDQRDDVPLTVTITKSITITTLYYTTLHYSTTLHYTTLHYTTLHYTTLLYSTLHYTTLHYTTLHYTIGRQASSSCRRAPRVPLAGLVSAPAKRVFSPKGT